MVDAEEYHRIAILLSQGKIDFALAFRAPIYPIFLSLVYMLLSAGPLLIRIIQILLGSLTCVMSGKIGQRIFGEKVGFASGMLVAVSGMMFYFDLELLPTTLAIFLMMWGLLKLFNAIEAYDKGKGFGKNYMYSGLLIGLAVLTRPTFIIFLPIIPIWLYVTFKKSRPAILFTLLPLLLLSTSLLIHLLSGAGPSLISAQGGANFYIGNIHGADGITAELPGVGAGWSWKTLAARPELESGRELNASEVDSYYWKLGIAEIKGDPGAWLKLMFRKARLFWNRVEISSNRDIYYHAAQVPVFGILLYLAFPLFVPFFLAGAVLNWQNRDVRLILLLTAGFFLLTILFFVNARFRHPVLPFLIILSAGGVKGGFDLLKDRTGMNKVLVTATVSAMIIGIILPLSVDSGVRKDRYDYGMFIEGLAYFRLGKTRIAEEKFLRALKHNINAPYINYNLGEIAFQSGDFTGAIAYYDRETQIQPQFVHAWNNMGIAALEMGEHKRALSFFTKTLEINPNFDQAARNSARVWAELGLQAAGEEEWQLALERFAYANELKPADPLYRTIFLEAKYNLGEIEGVLYELDRIILEYPTFNPAKELRDEVIEGIN